MIEVICRTNIDSWQLVKWPTQLVGMPAVGHWIEALEPASILLASGERKGERVTISCAQLQVVGITHRFHKFAPNISRPYVEVELHHPYARQMGYV